MIDDMTDDSNNNNIISTFNNNKFFYNKNKRRFKNYFVDYDIALIQPTFIIYTKSVSSCRATSGCSTRV